MTETTQKYRQIVRDEIDKLQPFESVMLYSAEFMRALLNDAGRLARIEHACLIRSEIDAPPEACWWSRYIKGNGEVECVWLDEYLDEVPVDGIAPNYPVNGAYATPIRLPIIET